MKLTPSSKYIDIQNTGIGNNTLHRTTPENNNKARRLTQQQIDAIKSRYNKGNNNITKKVKEGRKTQKIPMIKRNWELHEEKDNKQIQENLQENFPYGDTLQEIKSEHSIRIWLQNQNGLRIGKGMEKVKTIMEMMKYRKSYTNQAESLCSVREI